MKRSGLPPNDPLRGLGDGLGQSLDSIIASWPSHRSSDHLRLEVAAAFDGDRKCALPSVDAMLAQGGADIEPRTRRWYLDHFSEPSVLDVDRPVPGCGCPGCTGIPSDHSVRQRQLRRRRAGHGRFDEMVDRARAVPLVAVVQRLGLGTPAQRGRELAVCCPLHDDSHPSLQLNPAKQVWYCHPCGIGGDAITLYMLTRRIEFAEAVRELAS